MVADDGARLVHVLARLSYVAATRGHDLERCMDPVFAVRMVGDRTDYCPRRSVAVRF